MPVPSPRNKILPVRGNIASLNAALADLLEGEICYAFDEDQYYQKEGGVLVPVGATKAQGLLADSAIQPGDNVSELTNDAAYVDAAGAAAAAPVQSVAGKVGAVTLVKGDVGLGNVDNTSDLNKPISTATQSALDLKADLVGGVIPNSQLPSLAISEYLGSVNSQAAMLALTGQRGDWCIRTDTGSTWVITTDGGSLLSHWTQLATPADAVTSVNGYTGAVVLGKADVGLGNVDNTSDLNKPVSTATQTALVLKANLTSPALTGTPTAPTATPGTNTTQLATTAFVADAVSTADEWTRTSTTLAPKTAGDVVAVSAGTAALPGLTPVGDSNTGLFAPAADTLALSTNGTEKVRITSDGKVGIGATAPDASLVVARQVSDLIARFGSLATNAGAWIRLQGKDSLGTSNQFWDIRNNVDGSLSFNGNTSLLPERARITSDGYLRLAAGSLGIQFGGDTAAADALDDYEEGTFTPTIIGATAAGTGTYTLQIGSYTKIGNAVSFFCRVIWSAHTGTGFMRINGLPFTVPLVSNKAIPCATYPIDLTVAANGIATAVAWPGSTQLQLFSFPAGGGAASTVTVDTAADISVSGTYYV